MAKEAVIHLFRATQNDSTLKKKLNTALTAKDFVDMAQAHGFHFTIEEWQDVTGFAVEELEGELSEIPGI